MRRPSLPDAASVATGFAVWIGSSAYCLFTSAGNLYTPILPGSPVLSQVILSAGLIAVLFLVARVHWRMSKVTCSFARTMRLGLPHLTWSFLFGCLFLVAGSSLLLESVFVVERTIGIQSGFSWISAPMDYAFALHTGERSNVTLVYSSPLPYLLLAGLVAAFREELLFRGYLRYLAFDRLGRLPSVILTSILFSLYHWTPQAVLMLFLAGVIFAVLVDRVGSIWPAVGVHFLANQLVGVSSAPRDEPLFFLHEWVVFAKSPLPAIFVALVGGVIVFVGFRILKRPAASGGSITKSLGGS